MNPADEVAWSWRAVVLRDLLQVWRYSRGAREVLWAHWTSRPEHVRVGQPDRGRLRYHAESLRALQHVWRWC